MLDFDKELAAFHRLLEEVDREEARLRSFDAMSPGTVDEPRENGPHVGVAVEIATTQISTRTVRDRLGRSVGESAGTMRSSKVLSQQRLGWSGITRPALAGVVVATVTFTAVLLSHNGRGDSQPESLIRTLKVHESGPESFRDVLALDLPPMEMRGQVETTDKLETGSVARPHPTASSAIVTDSVEAVYSNTDTTGAGIDTSIVSLPAMAVKGVTPRLPSAVTSTPVGPWLGQVRMRTAVADTTNPAADVPLATAVRGEHTADVFRDLERIGDERFAAGEYVEALRVYQRADKIRPGHPALVEKIRLASNAATIAELPSAFFRADSTDSSR